MFTKIKNAIVSWFNNAVEYVKGLFSSKEEKAQVAADKADKEKVAELATAFAEANFSKLTLIEVLPVGTTTVEIADRANSITSVETLAQAIVTALDKCNSSEVEFLLKALSNPLIKDLTNGTFGDVFAMQDVIIRLLRTDIDEVEDFDNMIEIADFFLSYSKTTAGNIETRKFLESLVENRLDMLTQASRKRNSK